ncbi:SDR family oxidoreductase [Terricaulis sp.]|uniref:SDR family oxidoreductase n=1 Tax=Terricaulis sp. TaxID=2768686 RepID=UPI003783E499
MTRRALVIGAGDAVGERVACHLADGGWRVTGSMRRKRDDVVARLAAYGVAAAFHDLTQDDWRAAAEDADALVITARLDLAAEALTKSGLRCARTIVFSSNNVATFADTPVYRALAAAETAVRNYDPNLIIVRPTLIYGDPRLPTVPRLIAMARRWPVMVAPGSGKALVQPVFHHDLAASAAGLLEAGAAGGVYAIGGPDIVSMRALFAAAADAAGRPGKPVLCIPKEALQLAAPLLSLFAPYSPAQAARADRDRVAAPQTSLPPDLAPRTPLRAGLTALVSALDGSPVAGR